MPHTVPASDPTLVCPHCRQPIELTEALAAPLLAARLAEERARITAEVRASAQESVAAELQRLQQETREQKSKLDESRRRELDVLSKERALEERRAALDLELAQRLGAEREKAAKHARDAVSAELGAQIAELRADADAKGKKLVEAQAAELALRRDKAALEAAQREWELEKQRQIDAERTRIRGEAQRELGEEHRLKLLEKDEQLAGLTRKIEELKRRAEQGSQQTQGEALELDLEGLLRHAFPHDGIEPVGKGVRGGDCIQRVHGPAGTAAGSILWESKNTKDWSKAWLPKLREDQREAKADVAILVTAVMPRDVERFGHVDGVWVCDRVSAVALATALRFGLLEAAGARASATGRESKMALLYEYLCGPQFRARVEGIVEAFSTMKADLDAEKRATERQWARREKQIERVLRSTSGMYGDLQGIAGSSLPELPSLAGPGDARDGQAELRALPDATSAT